jgi:hypothetical protein
MDGYHLYDQSYNQRASFSEEGQYLGKRGLSNTENILNRQLSQPPATGDMMGGKFGKTKSVLDVFEE